jgi:hypothetical protein
MIFCASWFAGRLFRLQILKNLYSVVTLISNADHPVVLIDGDSPRIGDHPWTATDRSERGQNLPYDARAIFGVNGLYRVLTPTLVALRSGQTASSFAEKRRGAS